jgi:hypothetical protein
MAGQLAPSESGVGSFHVHRGHAFEGFELRGGQLAALCACGSTLDVADAAFARCPVCAGAGGCLRCAGTGVVIDHAALAWRLPPTT